MPFKKTVVGVGERFGNLEAVQEAPKSGKHRYMLCRCSCGAEKIVKLSHLRDGRIRSCGHLREGERASDQPTSVVGAVWLPLTQKNWTLVDEEDAEFLRDKKLRTHTGYASFYAKSGRWAYRTVMVHRWIMGVVEKVPAEVEVDHINGNRLDNRRANLRLCTRRENAMNVSGRAPISGFKGVVRARGKWLAQVQADHVNHRVGLFETAEEAARAYDTAAKRLHGQFARLNFPG